MGMVQEFKDFALKGNFFDMAIGVVIGGAFGKIVGSMIEDIIMPIVGMAGKADFTSMKHLLKAKDAADPTSTDNFLKYGNFLTVAVNFLIVAFVLFLVIRFMNQLKRKDETAPAPPKPTRQEELLVEIRDLLKKS